MTIAQDCSSGYLQLHFYTEDGSHSMDAATLNKCVYEYLGIIKEVCSKFQLEACVESEALSEGGIRHWLKINLPSKEAFKTALILALLVDIVKAPITTPFAVLVEKVVERILTPEEIRKLEDEKTKAELEYQIAWYREETKKLADTINTNVISKKKSNFYTSVKECSKVNSVEFTYADEKKDTIVQTSVARCDFDKYILASDELEPKEIDEAIIEIVSPVLKKGKYKWTGIYNGEVIQFSVKSNEFKTLVQTGMIAFKNGTSMKCELRIKRKLDAEGNEKITGYEVWSVDATFENDKPIETPEGKRKRQQKEADDMQLTFDF